MLNTLPTYLFVEHNKFVEFMEIYEILSLESLPNEEWRDVVGWEEAYQVSNLGRVRSKNRIVTSQRYKNRHQIGKVLKQRFDKDGYLTFNAKWKNRNQLLKVHREVAKAFIPNPNNYPCIDHKNGIRNDNRIENLRWCTVKMNSNYELAKKNRSEAIKQSYVNNPALRTIRANTFGKSNMKKVEVFENGNSLGIFESQSSAAAFLGITQSLISSYTLGKTISTKGITVKQI